MSIPVPNFTAEVGRIDGGSELTGSFGKQKARVTSKAETSLRIPIIAVVTYSLADTLKIEIGSILASKTLIFYPGFAAIIS